MGRWHRFLLGTARDLPDLVPYMLSLSNAMARRLGPSGFHRKLYAGSEADRTTAASLDFQCVQAAAREILIGADGALLKAVHDGLIASTRHDLRPDLAALEGGAPVHLLSGAQSLRADPAEALAIERAFPWIDYQRFDQAGELLHLQETPRLLALAARHATPPAPPPGPDAAGGQS
ncbi:hypothetical protein [Pseudooceanicola sp. 200-1SW]|uniref:hypothetical protein n=1 Tax=Pseudooceanicola sp. 200-1SW TaxID=3425949 RepID=UPI003D7FAD01